MKRTQIEDAIESKQPFVIQTADGREFTVLTRDHIALSRKGTYAVVFGDDDSLTSIPLVMMASVSDKPTPGIESD